MVGIIEKFKRHDIFFLVFCPIIELVGVRIMILPIQFNHVSLVYGHYIRVVLMSKGVLR